MDNVIQTETELKLRDAAIQMKLALDAAEDDIFRSCVNSFISHARSVTFVMQTESASDPVLSEWYTKVMSVIKEMPIMKFFNEKRVHSIHKGVVKPNKTITPIKNFQVDGVLQIGTGSMSMWTFDDIQKFLPGDSGNVYRLCEQYYLILKWLVERWLKKKKELIEKRTANNNEDVQSEPEMDVAVLLTDLRMNTIAFFPKSRVSPRDARRMIIDQINEGLPDVLIIGRLVSIGLPCEWVEHHLKEIRQ